jgi:integrase/recombinase XerD
MIKSGLHNPSSRRVKDHFNQHYCRHWLTVHLCKARMPRYFIKEFRGDKRRDAMDVYYHIDKEEFEKSYLACIPQLDI